MDEKMLAASIQMVKERLLAACANEALIAAYPGTTQEQKLLSQQTRHEAAAACQRVGLSHEEVTELVNTALRRPAAVASTGAEERHKLINELVSGWLEDDTTYSCKDKAFILETCLENESLYDDRELLAEPIQQAMHEIMNCVDTGAY